MGERTVHETGCGVGGQREHQHLHSHVAGGQDLGNRGHADHRASHAAQHPHLGRGLERGTLDRCIDALTYHKSGFCRRRFCQLTELGIVGLAHVRELGSELTTPLSRQRVDAQQIEVVVDHHQRTGTDLGVERAGGVGRDHHLGTEERCQAHRRHHLFQTVALVEVEAAVEDHQGLAAPPPQSNGLAMPHQGVQGEGEDLLEIHFLRRIPSRHLEPKARSRHEESEHEARLVLLAEIFGHAPHLVGGQHTAHSWEPSTGEIGIRN